jgi:hypothetical protein
MQRYAQPRLARLEPLVQIAAQSSISTPMHKKGGCFSSPSPYQRPTLAKGEKLSDVASFTVTSGTPAP